MAETIIIDADEDSYEAYDADDSDSSGAVGTTTEDETSPVGDDSKVSDEDEVEVEGRPAAVSTEQDEVSKLKDEVRELRTALLQTVQQQRQPVAAAAPAAQEEKVTKAQLVQILNENKDPDTGNIRPDILMNVVDYLVENKTAEVKDKAFAELNQSSWEREVSGVSNRVLQEDKYLAANPALNAKIDEITNNLKLGDHPAGRLAAYALIRLSAGEEISADEKAAVTATVKKAANPGKMDKTHVGIVPSKGKSTKLTQEQLQMAKRFGVKPEMYARFVGGK